MSLRFPIGFLIYLTANPLIAQEQLELERWYDVEIIVIQNLDFERNNTESWPPTGRLPDYTNSIDLFPVAEDELDESDGSHDLESSESMTRTAGLTEEITPEKSEFSYPEPFSIPEKEELSLANVYGSLRRSRNFRPLLHLSWTQPPLERGEAQPVRIYIPEEEPTSKTESERARVSRQSVFSDNSAEFDADNDGQEELETLEPNFLPEAWFDPSRIDLKRPLDGTATLIVSRFLHLYMDIVFQPVEPDMISSDELLPGTDPESLRRELTRLLANDEITLEEARARMSTSRSRDFYGFRLDQSRRMRNGEIHFFDHPAFSVIVLIEPRDFELPETSQENVATALQQLDQ